MKQNIFGSSRLNCGLFTAVLILLKSITYSVYVSLVLFMHLTGLKPIKTTKMMSQKLYKQKFNNLKLELAGRARKWDSGVAAGRDSSQR